jgi:hypothetical protein
LAHFDWGLLIVMAEKRKALLFSWVSYCDNRERFFMFDYDKKEKEHQNTRQFD